MHTSTDQVIEEDCNHCNISNISSTTTTTTTTSANSPTGRSSFWSKFLDFYDDYEILILFCVVILLAKVYPPLGATYLVPRITATWIAVVFIFVVAGLGLKTEEFHSAFKAIYFNVFVQTFNFGAVSVFVVGFTRLLVFLHNEVMSITTTTATDNTATSTPPQQASSSVLEPLVHGMIICSCLPMAINMVFILTKTAGGDEAAAILNASFGNMVGVFLSPLLILAYLGVSVSGNANHDNKNDEAEDDQVHLWDVFSKLAVRIVLPLMVGQVIHKKSPRVVHWMTKYARQVKKAQIYALVFVVYTVFCTTFASGTAMPLNYVILVIGLQFILLSMLSLVAWLALTTLFPNQPELCVMGLFGCTHKTVSVGVPMINAMYEGSSTIGLYTLPLLIWHPMQLLIGSILAPHLKAYIQRERLRLDKCAGVTSIADAKEKFEQDRYETNNNSNTPHDISSQQNDIAIPNEQSSLIAHGHQQS